MNTNRILFFFVFAAMLLAGCISGETPASVVPMDAKAGDIVNLESCTYEAEKIEYAADCGTLVVPENRSNPGSRLIALPVIRIHALNKRYAEPVFFFMGGPGKTNLEFDKFGGVVAERDFVQVGYRGIDGSSRLQCPEAISAIKASDDMLSPAALDSFAANISSCARRLQGEGVDIAGYTLLERVEDMEAARKALGYEKIDLLSESVGTRTAMLYGQVHPESIHRSVMIAVNPPGHFLWKAEVLDQQLAYYSELCARDAACSARTDNLAETIRQVARQMPERWLFMPIDAGAAKLGTFFLMFETSADIPSPMVIDAWLSAAEGDASGLAMISLFSRMLFPTAFVWGESSNMTVGLDLPVVKDYMATANLEDTILGTPGSTWMWGGMAAWPAEILPEEFRRVQPSDVETLLVGGTIDLSTPIQFARDELLPSLKNGQIVALHDFGHTTDVWGIQNDATAHLVNSFYSTGVADDSRFAEHTIAFDFGWLGLSELAKIGLGIFAAILLGLTALVVAIVRRIQRSRARRQYA